MLGAVALGGALLLMRALGVAASPEPLGSGRLAVAYGPTGRVDSVRAFQLDSGYVAHRWAGDGLVPGVRDGFDEWAVRPDLKTAAVACPVAGVPAWAVCERPLGSADTTRRPLGRYDVGADFVGWMPDGASFVMLGGYLRADGRYARALLFGDTSGEAPRVIARDRYDYAAASLSPTGDRLLADRRAPDERGTVLVTPAGLLLGSMSWCPMEGGVAWAHDGERIACVAEGGRALLLGYPFAGSRPTRVPIPERITGAPVWAPDNLYVAVITGETEPALYIVDKYGMAEPRVARRWDTPVHLLGWVPVDPRPVVRALRVRPDSVALHPGDRTTLRVDAYGDGGNQLGMAAGVRWAALDPTVARVTRAGEVQGLKAGVTRVVASLGVSAADTAVVLVVR